MPALYKKLIIYSILILAYHCTLGQSGTEENHLILGKVSSNTGEALEGVFITVIPLNINTVTDQAGRFRFSLPAGEYKINFQHLGMENYEEEVTLEEDISLQVELEYSAINLKQVEIISKPTMDVNSVHMGSTTMDLETLTRLPAFLGEVDVVRSITTLPGVASGGEGSAGFYVRGGGADQNLILMDDAPVFNSAHLFGFFSVYNPDALRSFTLYRSGISAQHGGRISSILDVKLKDGNEEKINYSAGISPVTASIGVEGPLTSKTTFLFSGRGAYPQYLLKLFPDDDVKNSSGYFYDANLKIKHTLNENNIINFSSYYSNDGFKFPYDTLYNWSNLLGSLKWFHLFNNEFSSTFSLVKSIYNNKVEGAQTGNEFKLSTGIDFTQLKAEFSYTGWTGHILDFGAGVSDYQIQPGNLNTYGSSSYNTMALQEDHGIEAYSYLNNEIRINNQISLNLGLRHSYFQKRGPYDVFIYDENIPRSEHSVVDTLSFAKQAVQTYHGFEPRASLKYSLNNTSSLKAALNRTRQYIQLISNTAGITPVDIWKLSNPYIKPQIADQASLGYFFVQGNNAYEFSWEIYYRDLHNQLDYKDRAEIILNPLLEAELLTGRGYAYGSEWLVKKNDGRLNGWFSLSYSRSLRIIKGETREETINNGLSYPSNFDKPVSLNLFLNYQLNNSNWTFSSNFNYSTGRPITAADSWYYYYGKIYTNYYGRNQQRMPDYHRLDLSFNYTAPASKKIKDSWSFSVYNLYFRRNAYSTLFRHYQGRPPSAYKLAVIGIAVPSISYKIEF